jgi:hypothetical protein
MLDQKVNKNDLVRKLYRRLTLVEIETKLIKISCNLMEDEVYTVDDAVNEIIEILNLIEMESEEIMNDLRFH